MTFENWKNAATTKRLDGFAVDIFEKVEYTISSGAKSNRLSIISKFISAKYPLMTALVTTDSLESYILVNAHAAAAETEFKFKIVTKLQISNDAKLVITVPSNL